MRGCRVHIRFHQKRLHSALTVRILVLLHVYKNIENPTNNLVKCRDDKDDTEGRHALCAPIKRISTHIQLHAGHDLTQSTTGTPKGQTAHGVTATEFAAITEIVTPPSVRNIMRVCLTGATR